jgi:hypothetical protein
MFMQTLNSQNPGKGEERINVLSEMEIAYWCSKLCITEQQLRNAIFIEGPMVNNVIAYLIRHGLISPS